MRKMIAHIGLVVLVIISNVKPMEQRSEFTFKNIPVDDVYFWQHGHASVNKREALQTAAAAAKDNVAPEHNKAQVSDNVQQVNSNVPQAKTNDDSNVKPENPGGANPPPVAPGNTPAKTDANIDIQNATEPLKEASPVNNNSQVAPSAIKSEITTVKPTDVVNILPLNNAGVVKRGLIVFGGFALLAVAYLIFYRRKGKNYDSNNMHNNNDTNQFRYGVLQSEEGRDNLELSRIPLTMESDDDEEDDLEIFDLEQKKKSLSYVNLQVNDEDIVFHDRKDESKNNLLLDIEDGLDGPSDMINWSSTSNKSII